MVKPVIIQPGDQIHSQHKSSTAIAIALGENAKDFQMPNDMFNDDALLCQFFVQSLLRPRQRAALRTLDRSSRLLAVELSQALITTVGQTFNPLR